MQTLNVFLISVKIEMSDTVSDTEECLNSLDAWLKIYKNKIYDENIKGDENSKQVLLKYKYSFAAATTYAAQHTSAAAQCCSDWRSASQCCQRGSCCCSKTQAQHAKRWHTAG